MSTLLPLPAYPSHAALATLSPSQQSILTQSISDSLLQTLALPPNKRDTPATYAFISSYAKEEAAHLLQALIWDDPNEKATKRKTVDADIRKRVLLLAEKLALSPPGLSIQTLLDLCIIYSATRPKKLRDILSHCLAAAPDTLTSPNVPYAFTSMLSPASNEGGLYALRKTSHCLLVLLRSSPPPLLKMFSSSKPFMLSLGKAYGEGLSVIARSYGGLRAHEIDSSSTGEGDEWERVFTETKVALMDSFHLLMSAMLKDLASAGTGSNLGREIERVFEIIFSLLNQPSSSSGQPLTPFLNRPLLADYQNAYDLSHTLSSVLQHSSSQEEADARLQLLEASLNEFTGEAEGSGLERKDPGALKILLRSSGVPPGIDNLGRGKGHHKDSDIRADIKGKGKAAMTTREDPDLDLKTSEILSILPDHDPSLIRRLLARPGSTVESVLGALLEGVINFDDGVQDELAENELADQIAEEEFVFTKERRNVFDDEIMDLNSVRIGKKAFVSLRLSSFVGDILTYVS